MVHKLRFQVMMIPNVPWPQYLDRFLHVESLGFEVAGLPDHFCDWAHPPSPWLEAWTSLAAVAARTSTLRLATYVSQIPLRNPAILANQARHGRPGVKRSRRARSRYRPDHRPV